MTIHVRTRSIVTAVLVGALGLLLTGCGGQSPDPHAGHNHGPSTASARHTHAVQGETCFICDASKRDKGRLWCREHGRYEERCWLCHPELEDPDRPYCTEHFLYEDECFLCRPELKRGGHEGHDHGHDGHDHDHDDHEGHDHDDHGDHEGHDHAGHDHGHNHGHGGSHSMVNGVLWCNEHGVAEMECVICQPQLVEMLEPGGEMKIRFVSMESTAKAGVRTGRAVRTTSEANTLTAFCEVRLNQNSLAQITPLAAGVIRRVLVDVGSRVEEGTPLVELHSNEVASARSAYLAAMVQRELQQQATERERALVDQHIGARRELEAAEAALRLARLDVTTARQLLENLGLDEDEIRRTAEEESTSARLIVRAPYAGTITARNAVAGESAIPGASLLTLADLDMVWIELSVPAGFMHRLRIGSSVRATFDAIPDRVFLADLTWIDAVIDEKTRMVRARAIMPNPDGVLRAGLFGQATIAGAPGEDIWRLPREAVQRVNGKSFVFIHLEDDLYAARRVTIAHTSGAYTEVLAGLTENDRIVVDGSHVVYSEMLKSRLGAGCADH